MKAIGIIAEYNPFHNGHKYQIEMAKKLSGADVVVAIVTGYFSMRGDISVINKYDKAMIAINNGVDLVIELPFTKGCQSADYFAYNAVEILNNCKVDEIWAGSEQDDETRLNDIVELTKTPDFNKKIQAYLSLGNSYAKAFRDSLEEFGYQIGSNDMLNIKYLESINRINPNIKFHMIKRIGNNYSDKEFNDSKFQSATSIRNSDSFKEYVPIETYNIYKEKGFLDINKLSPYFFYNTLNTDLNNVFQANSEILSIITKEASNIEELVEISKCKRYTESKLRRFILYALFNMTNENIDESNYIRVLGFNSTGQSYLAKIKKETNIITNIRSNINKNIDFELKIAKIMTLVYDIDFLKIEQSLPYKK